jgi:hypothetical protein
MHFIDSVNYNMKLHEMNTQTFLHSYVLYNSGCDIKYIQDDRMS